MSTSTRPSGRMPPAARLPARRLFRPGRRTARPPGNPGEVRIGQIGAVGDDPGGFHFQFHERQRAVTEHNDLDRKLLLARGQRLAEQHRQPAISRERDDLPAGVGRLRADGVRQRVGHGPVAERADQPAGARSSAAASPVHPGAARHRDSTRQRRAEDGRVALRATFVTALAISSQASCGGQVRSSAAEAGGIGQQVRAIAPSIRAHCGWAMSRRKWQADRIDPATVTRADIAFAEVRSRGALGRKVRAAMATSP